MPDIPLDLTFVSAAAAAVAYAVLAAHFWRLQRAAADADVDAPPRHAAPTLFLLAALATVAWGAATAVDRGAAVTAPAYAAAAFDIARYALWCVFLLALLRPPRPRRPSALVVTTLVLTLAATAAWAMRVAQQRWEADASPAATAAALAFAVLGLVLVEQLFRNLPPDTRWNAKPLCLALGLTFAFDLYLYSEALLLGQLDTDAASVRGAVAVAAMPLLVAASRGRADWIRRLQVSRAMAFHSATLVLVGAYLLFMAGVGYYVRYFGGEWGRALQLALLAAGTAALAALVLSGSLRSRLKVFVGKNFFSYRYDYREEWLRFTRMLASNHAPQEVGTLIVRGLANLVECPAGDLWTRAADGAEFRQTARWNMSPVVEREPAQSSFGAFLADKGWVVDLNEYRNAPRHYGDLALPAWLLARSDVWLVVPLAVGDELLGFALLSTPRTPVDVDWEVRDLLKTAAQQAAGYLAQMQATEALLEARKFEAFNRMSAFVVHDLKNIVTQLSLMTKNAQRLHANPEFQQDMLLTVDSSLEKMRRLMLQLREGATPPGVAHGVSLRSVVAKLEAEARDRGRKLQTSCDEDVATRGHADRLERVLGHLVQNAFEATPEDGRVWIAARRRSGQVEVEIGDTGSGMDEDFVENRLFRPFSTTKHGGMGIGTYESFQYVRELGGTIAVDSRVGHGTVMRLSLPLFSTGSEAGATPATSAP